MSARGKGRADNMEVLGGRTMEPDGPRPKRWFSPARILVYSVLAVTSIYYLFPLYIMLITSIKDLDTIRDGNIFIPPSSPTVEPWIKVDLRLHGALLQWNSGRVLELRQDNCAIRGRVDRRGVRNRLFARHLAVPHVRGILHRAVDRLVYSLPGDALPAGHHHSGARHILHAMGGHSHPHDLRTADPDIALPQLFRIPAARAD
jgi:hypothetical protein